MNDNSNEAKVVRKSKRIKTESIWTEKKIAAIKKKYGVDKVYLCHKNGADALAYWGDQYLRVVKGSIAAPSIKNSTPSKTSFMNTDTLA